MKQYQVMGHLVEPFEENNKNVLVLNVEKHDVICNGDGDQWVVIDGHKRYLEDPTPEVMPLSKCKSLIAGAIDIERAQVIIDGK